MAQQTTWTADSILNFLGEHRSTLRDLGVQKIGLFGSYVRGEQQPDSDIDMLVTMQDWAFKRYAKLWSFLEDHLECKVDLVPEDALREELRPYILSEVRYVQNL